MNDGLVLKISNTGTDNWKIRFNASLASCVSIESTHAPLLVYKFSGMLRQRDNSLVSYGTLLTSLLDISGSAVGSSVKDRYAATCFFPRLGTSSGPKFS